MVIGIPLSGAAISVGVPLAWHTTAIRPNPDWPPVVAVCFYVSLFAVSLIVESFILSKMLKDTATRSAIWKVSGITNVVTFVLVYCVVLLPYYYAHNKLGAGHSHKTAQATKPAVNRTPIRTNSGAPPRLADVARPGFPKHAITERDEQTTE